jgi:glycosyltransferase involved in cell wall biosynthesis
MYKILLLANSLAKPGGAGRVEAYFIKALAMEKIRTIVVSSKPHKSNMDLIGDISKESIKWYLSTAPKLQSLNIERRFIENIIERENPEVIVLFGGLPKRIRDVARKVNAKIIVYYHMIAPWYVEIRGFYRKYRWGDLSMLYFAFNLALSRRLSCDLDPWGCADIVVVNSDYMRFLARRYWGREPYVLHPPIEIEKFSYRSLLSREPSVIVVGRLNRDKRFEETIQAVGMLDNSLKRRIIVHIVGFLEDSNYLQELISLAKKLSVRLRISINMPEREKLYVLSKSMVFVNNSRHEHFGIAVIEAMASGTPVIVHRSGEPWLGIVARGAYCFGYGDVAELSRQLEMVFTNEGLWNRLSQLSIARSKEYDFKVFKERLLKIILGT